MLVVKYFTNYLQLPKVRKLINKGVLKANIDSVNEIPPDAVISGVKKSSGSYELVVSVVLMGLIGYGLDRWLDLLPIFTATLSIVGFLGASISIYFRYKESMSKENEKRWTQ